jgi:uncharacterized protein YjgD (DUF1641 family)
VKNFLHNIKAEYIDIWQYELPSVRFQKAFEVFKVAMSIDLEEKIDQLSKERSKWVRSAQNRGLTNQLSNRSKYYDNLIQFISDDLLRNFKDIMLAHCEDIEKESLNTIHQYIIQVFRGQLNQAKESEKRFLISIGRNEILKSLLLPIESKFSTAISKNIESIGYIVGKFNLEKQTEKLAHNRKRQLEVINSLGKWLPLSAGGTYILQWLLSKLPFLQ